MQDLEEIAKIKDLIRAEVEKYAGRPVGDTENLVSELLILGDDLSAIALALEARVGVKVERHLYRGVNNIQEYALLLSSKLSART